jgi:hypothetical protein
MPANVIGALNMATRSAIDEFSAGIITRVSVYLTACLGMLLTIAMLVRTLDPLEAKRLTPTDELLTLFVTLLFTYIAVWCAGFLAVASTKKKLLQSSKGNFRRDSSRSENRRLAKRTTETTGLAPEERGSTAPKRQPAPFFWSRIGEATFPSKVPDSPRESVRDGVMGNMNDRDDQVGNRPDHDQDNCEHSASSPSKHAGFPEIN